MADTVAVASTVYNMAGDVEGRPDFLKSLVIGGIAQGKVSLGQAIVESYRNSPAFRLRRFLEWSKNDADFNAHIGSTEATIPGAFYPVIPFRHDNKAVGPRGSGIRDWLIDIGFELAPALQDIQVKGGPITDANIMEPDILSTNGNQVLVQNTAVEFPLSVALMASDARFRTVTFPPLVPGPDPEIGPWTAFPATPVPNTIYPEMESLYPVAKKAFKRALNADFDDVQDRILSNVSIDNIDYASAQFGVAFNVKDQSSRKYVYRFFQHLMQVTDTYSISEESAWLAQWMSNSSFPPPPWQEVRIESVRTDGTRNWRTDIRWAFIHEQTGTGLLKLGAQVDEVWFEVSADPLSNYPTSDPPDGFNQKVTLNWQETNNSWRRLTITGLQHRNYVYTDNYVFTTAKAALQNTTKESEFLVPLFDLVYDTMPFVDAMQMASSCGFLVFNSFEVDKEEWYETWWFKVIVIVVVVAISIVAAVFTGGTSLGAGAGLVGLLTGAGLSTTAAIIIAAAAESLAGILLAFLINEGATALFGEEWGPLIGAIVSTIVTLGMSMGSLAEAINSLSKPDTWMALAVATGNGVANYLQSQAQQVWEDTAKMLEQYGEKSAEVQRLFNEMTGNQNGIDVSLVNKYISEVTEKPMDFLRRTLATGSDIVDITLGQIDNFVGNNLRLLLP